MNEELTKATLDLATRAQGLEVVDRATADRAAELILAGKGMVKKIKDFFTKLKRAQDEAKQVLISAEKEELIKVEPVLERLNLSLSAWEDEQKKKRLEAEAAVRRAEDERRRLEEDLLRKVREAEEQAERERQGLEREAEKLRQEATKAADDGAAMKRIEAERDKLRLQAEENRKRADEATNRALDEAAKAEAALAPAPVVPERVRFEGLAERTYWKATVVDFPQLIAAVATAQISLEALLPNMSFLNDMATRLKGQVVIPGVRMESETRMVKTR